MTVGCSRSEQPTNRKAEVPSFVVTRLAADCGCWSMTRYYARGNMKISPAIKFDGKQKTAENLKAELQSESLSGLNTLTILSAKDLFTELKKHDRTVPLPLFVLLHEKGHFYELLGEIEIDGVRLFQLIHGMSPVWLVSLNQLEQAGFVEAWKFPVLEGDIPILVGKSKLTVDHLRHNFGEILPTEDVSCSFVFQNRGEKAVIFKRPVTSCSCMVPNLHKGATIKPGEKLVMDVNFTPNGSISTRQTIGITCFEEGTEALQSFVLELLGNQRRSMEVRSSELNFGTILPGQRVDRVVVLKEVPTDRFKIEKIEVGVIPVSFSTETIEEADKLNLYRTRVSFLAEENAALFQTPGKQTGKIIFYTDSHQYPEVVIPVVFEIPPAIRAIPSILSFGMVPEGQRREIEVEFISRNGENIEISFKSTPEFVTVKPLTKDGASFVIIQFSAKDPGIWEGEIALELKAGSLIENLNLKYAAYVQKK